MLLSLAFYTWHLYWSCMRFLACWMPWWKCIPINKPIVVERKVHLLALLDVVLDSCVDWGRYLRQINVSTVNKCAAHHDQICVVRWYTKSIDGKHVHAYLPTPHHVQLFMVLSGEMFGGQRGWIIFGSSELSYIKLHSYNSESTSLSWVEEFSSIKLIEQTK